MTFSTTIPADDLAVAQARRWPAARAWAWYRSQPWLCGFNYVPANSISYTEMWMGYAFDPALIDRELALAEAIGFNVLRVVLPFVVWETEPAAFQARFEQFLTLCARRGLRALPCFFDDCVFGPITDPEFGQQPDVVDGWYANGWTPSPGHARVSDLDVRPHLEQYVKSILSAHHDDVRVAGWDLYNEPGNSGLEDDSLPLLVDAFRWAREIDPAQPITSGVWRRTGACDDFVKIASDVVTFHNYGPAGDLRQHIAELASFDRPLICTEWLNRPRGSTTLDCLPVLREAGVGAIHWGLVNGKTQTHLPWGHRPGDPAPVVWQHDLYRIDGDGSYTAYDAQEIALFTDAIRRARTG